MFPEGLNIQGGQSSPGNFIFGGQPLKGQRQIPQSSSLTSHFHSATAVHCLIVIFNGVCDLLVSICKVGNKNWWFLCPKTAKRATNVSSPESRMLEALQAQKNKMKSPQGGTVLKQPGVRAINESASTYLVISRSWKAVYNWVNSDVKLVLFTSKSIRSTFTYEDAANYTLVESFEDLDSFYIDWRAEELHLIHNFKGVVCLSEEDLLRCARIRKRLGITSGQTEENATRYRDKIYMKSILKSSDILVPKCVSGQNQQDIISFYKEFGPKIVIKPSLGYGSVNTTIITSNEDLVKFFQTTKVSLDTPLNLDIEQFIEGVMYHIDGFVSEGKLRLCWPSKYLNMCLDFTTADYNASHSLQKDNPLVPRLQSFIDKVVTSLEGPSFFPFHAEVWHTPNDELILCEIASRVGGAGIRHAFEGLFNIMLDSLWVKAQCNCPIDYDMITNYSERFPDDKNKTTGWIIIFPREGTLTSIPEKESGESLPFVLKYFPIASVGTTFKKASHSADAVAMIIVKGEDEEDVSKNVFKAFDWFQQAAVWK